MFHVDELGPLADPDRYCEPIDVKGENLEVLASELEMMIRIRRAEEWIADKIVAGDIKCPCHLAIGQEAISVGVSHHLRPTDRAFGTHRSHGHYLALGLSVESLFAEILGRATGCSKGMGGSMHLYGEKNGFKGSVPIVAGTISMAVGAALAARMDKKTDLDVGVSYFGDGAAEEGSLHESLNFASVFRLPKLFVCENNLFSSHLHIKLRQPSNVVARYAAAHKVAYRVVDGNDLLAVRKAAGELIEASRKGEGPGFLETITYRWRGHVGPKEDNDVGLKRGEELYLWRKRDPVGRLHEGMKKTFPKWTDQNMTAIETKIAKEMQQAWAAAVAAPFPPTEQLMDAVYKHKNEASL